MRKTPPTSCPHLTVPDRSLAHFYMLRFLLKIVLQPTPRKESHMTSPIAATTATASLGVATGIQPASPTLDSAAESATAPTVPSSGLQAARRACSGPSRPPIAYSGKNGNRLPRLRASSCPLCSPWFSVSLHFLRVEPPYSGKNGNRHPEKRGKRKKTRARKNLATFGHILATPARSPLARPQAPSLTLPAHAAYNPAGHACPREPGHQTRALPYNEVPA